MDTSPESTTQVMEDAKRVLIIKLGSLGDVVQVEGVIHDIRLHHPDATLFVLTTPPYRRFFERCPWIDEVVIDRREPRWNLFKMAALRSRLRSLNPDMVYDLQQVKRTHFYFRWFLHDVPWMGRAPGCRYQFPLVPGQCALQQFSDQLAAIGVPNTHSLHADLGWMADDMAGFLDEAGVESPFVVVIPSTSAGQEHRRWPFYDELAGWLAKRGVTPVMVPGPDEMDASRAFPRARILTEKNGDYLDFFKLAGIVQRASFVVGNDTGPMHIAAYLKKPGLALFSSRWPPTMTGIQFSALDWIEVEQLQELPLSRVTGEIETRCLGSAGQERLVGSQE